MKRFPYLDQKKNSFSLNPNKFLFRVPAGNGSLKNRAFTDTNDASFDSSYSAYLQETKQLQLAKAAQPTLNLSQSLSNIVDVSALSLAKDKYFEKPSMVSHRILLFSVYFKYCFYKML